MDFDGTGRRDIWSNQGDVLGSIANYLSSSGWHGGEPWGQPVRVPQTLDVSQTGREVQRSLGEWQGLGVRRDDGSAFSRTDPRGALILPDGAGGRPSWSTATSPPSRRYNPSDFYRVGGRRSG